MLLQHIPYKGITAQADPSPMSGLSAELEVVLGDEFAVYVASFCTYSPYKGMCMSR